MPISYIDLYCGKDVSVLMFMVVTVTNPVPIIVRNQDVTFSTEPVRVVHLDGWEISAKLVRKIF